MATDERSEAAAPAATVTGPALQAPEAPETQLQSPSEPRPEPPQAKPLEAPPDLPVVFRGYDRKATDAFLHKLEESFHRLTAERDGLRRRIDDLEDELAHHRSRSQAVADALISAQTLAHEVRAAAEREIESDRRDASTAKSFALEEAGEIRAKAQQEAAELVHQAREQANRMIDEVQRGIREQQHEAEHILENTKERLGALVSDLLNRIPASSGDTGVPPDGPA
jgi:cell division septum initiation protein DivIVA